MKDEILAHLNHPAQLERLYRANRTSFKRTFGMLYPELKGNMIAECWHERLHQEGDEINWGSRRELWLVAGASLLAAVIAKLPAIFAIDEEFFYTRNTVFVVFPLLTAYFAWRNRLSPGRLVLLSAVTLAGLIFINLLPDVRTSDTLVLSCLHLALFLWAVLGYAFTGEKEAREGKRLDFLKYNGDLVVMGALIVIAGFLMSGITVGLFSLIGFNIEAFYFRNVGVAGLAAMPIVATYLTQTNPHLVGKVSPVIARIFSPLVLVMLVIYLAAMVYSGKDPYNDREFLLIFNLLLIGVLAIIFFSLAGTSATSKSRAETWVLFLLSCVTMVVNGIALSAIVFRISEWGITPNRTAVLGANVLILVNLLLVAVQLFRTLTGRTGPDGVGRAISRYLPVYCLWAVIVTFIFPWVFGFK